jgi:DNA-binding transcriptional ArsR family regulator
MKVTAAIRAKYDKHTRIMQALAHPIRLFILEQLAGGERNVSELSSMVGLEMATVSRHLSLLKSAGLLQHEKRGAQVFYRIGAQCVLKLFDCVSAIESENNRH